MDTASGYKLADQRKTGLLIILAVSVILLVVELFSSEISQSRPTVDTMIMLNDFTGLSQEHFR
jgi:hypothetical protein